MTARLTRMTIFVIALLFACHDAMARKPSSDAGFKASTSLRYEIVRKLEHARENFTQGLEICDGALLESVGLYGHSALIRKRIDDGAELQRRRLPGDVFAEGITCMHGRIYQLTWREQYAIVYDAATLAAKSFLRYEGEGWGLTHDAQHLIMSDGSATLRFRDPEDFRVVRSIEVRDAGRLVRNLNELEYAHGLIFANVWQSDRIAIIDPASGAVRAWLELGELVTRFDRPKGWSVSDDVLNGIAYDARRDTFYITGKRWPALFELRLHGLPTPQPRQP